MPHITVHKLLLIFCRFVDLVPIGTKRGQRETNMAFTRFYGLANIKILPIPYYHMIPQGYQSENDNGTHTLIYIILNGVEIWISGTEKTYHFKWTRLGTEFIQISKFTFVQ